MSKVKDIFLKKFDGKMTKVIKFDIGYLWPPFDRFESLFSTEIKQTAVVGVDKEKDWEKFIELAHERLDEFINEVRDAATKAVNKGA